MPRESTDSISFIVQAHLTDKESSQTVRNLGENSINLLEASNKYGYFFVPRGSLLYIISVPAAEEDFDSGENIQIFNEKGSFNVNFDEEITHISLSSSDQFISVLSGDVLSILSVPNLVVEVITITLLFT
jgi:hypothetical protein